MRPDLCRCMRFVPLSAIGQPIHTYESYQERKKAYLVLDEGESILHELNGGTPVHTDREHADDG